MLLSNLRVVLVSTLHAGNVGAVCRAMANMGVRDLVVVAPRIPEGDWIEAERLACHATDILEARRTVATLSEAVADCAAVVGTSAREGLYRQHHRSPREAAQDILAIAKTGRVALVMGREDNGLENDEVAQCTHLLRIPSSPDYSSINLAQATKICLYELYTASEDFELSGEKSPPAEASARRRLFELWAECMLRIGFVKEDKLPHMMQGFQRIFSRGVKTADDANIMMGVARQMVWAANNPTTGGKR